VAQDLLDHVTLRWFEERDHFHRPATLGTDQWIDLEDAFDQHLRVGRQVAQVWLARLRTGAGAAGAPAAAATASAAFRRMPRALFEYQPQ
jgi:hypothetical protein